MHTGESSTAKKFLVFSHLMTAGTCAVQTQINGLDS